MKQTYAPQKHAENVAKEKTAEESQGLSMAALRTGAAMPNPGLIGRQVDLPDAMRAKMENAFGADLAAVRLYESRAVADAGAEAVTQGPNIAFAPGMLDFSSLRGQSLLGHEISHVVSQARGEVTGGGFLNDRALEARADREGAMAAAGQQVVMPTAALSPVTAASAAGPMQAKKPEDGIGDLPENIQISSPRPAGQTAPATTAAASDAKTTAAKKPAPPSRKPPTAPPPRPAAAPAKATAPAVPATRPAASAAKAPAKPARPAAAAPAKAAGTTTAGATAAVKGAVPAVPSTRPAARPAKATAAPARPAAAAPAKAAAGATAAGAGATTKARPARPTRPAPTAPPARTTAPAPQTAPAAPAQADDSDPIGSLAETIGDVTDPLNDQFEHLENLQEGDENASTVFSRAMTKMGISDESQERISAASDNLNNIAGLYSGLTGLGDDVEAYEEAKSQGLRSGQVDAKLSAAKNSADTLGAISGLSKNIATAAKNAGAVKFFDAAGNAVDLAGNLVETGQGMYHAIEAGMRGSNLAQAAASTKQNPNLTENDKRVLQINAQGVESADIDREQGIIDTTAGILNTSGSIASVAGSVPASIALGAGGTLVKAIGKQFVDYDTDQMHQRVVEEDLDAKGSAAAMKADKRYASIAGKMSDDVLRAAALRQKGYKSGTDREAFRGVTLERSKDLLKMTNDGVESAKKTTAALGVDPTAEKAETGIARKLGVSKELEEEEFMDANKLTNEGNAFYKGAEAGRAAKNRTMKEGAQYYGTKAKNAAAGALKTAGGKFANLGRGISKGASHVRDFVTNAQTRHNAWESVKSGATKAGQGVVNAGQSIRTGAQNAGKFMHDFATDPNKRKETWQGVKTGASNAATRVKNVAAHSAGKVKDWYHEGVDQYNINQADYKQMNVLRRAAWSMKNLPARLTAGTAKNRLATYKRAQDAHNADAIYDDMEQRKRAASATP